MPKFRNRFTSVGIATYPAGRHADGANNLYLEVKEAGGARKTEGRYFIYRLNRDGRVSWRSIGVWPAVSLKMARAKADQWNHALFMGTDPWAAEVKIPTFRECVRTYLDEVLVVKNHKTRIHWELVLGERYCGRILAKWVDEITVNDMLSILKPVWMMKRATGICIRSRAERILTYAKGRGWRSGENVAAWKDNLEGLLSTQGRVSEFKDTFASLIENLAAARECMEKVARAFIPPPEWTRVLLKG